MTDTPTTDETEPNRQQTTQRQSTATDARGSESDASNVGTYLSYALLAGLSLLALVAALQFYVNASSALNQWISDEYRSLFQAAFNLVVLLVAAAGITWQVRRLGGSDAGE
jgi:hypothetical protein